MSFCGALTSICWIEEAVCDDMDHSDVFNITISPRVRYIYININICEMIMDTKR